MTGLQRQYWFYLSPIYLIYLNVASLSQTHDLNLFE